MAVPLRIVSAHTTSERRVAPEWTVAQLKARLEPITGVPIEHQRILLNGDELAAPDTALLASLSLVPLSELQVRHTCCMAIRLRTLCLIHRCLTSSDVCR
jgi:tubulin-folding cofactor B